MNLGHSISFAMVFVEGFVSFFSPCVIPLIPLYMGYLAGGASQKDENGNVTYKRKNIMLHTIFFILGISAAFFILGLGFSTLGSILKEHRDIISKVGGVIIIILGLNQLGLFKIKFLNKQLKMNNKVSSKKMNPIAAFVMGFGFSFAWTPCVGPSLASVLIMASNAKSVVEGNLLMLVYILGFLIPFVILGVFTGETLNFIKKNPKIMDVVVKIGAVVLIAMGVILFTGTLDKIEGGFGQLTQEQSADSYSDKEDMMDNKKDDSKKEDSKNTVAIDDSKKDDKAKEGKSSEGKDGEGENSDHKNPPMPPIILKDQDGKTVDLSKQKGKAMFVNFFATWCPPCRHEIPDIQKLYDETGKNKKDTFVVGIVSINDGRQSLEGVKKFIKKMKITYPILIDDGATVFQQFGAYSLPTTFFVRKDQVIQGYVPGAIPYETMDKLLKETLAK